MSECQRDMKKSGKPYPRTCPRCGVFGKCRKYPDGMEPDDPGIVSFNATTSNPPRVEVAIPEQGATFTIPQSALPLAEIVLHTNDGDLKYVLLTPELEQVLAEHYGKKEGQE